MTQRIFFVLITGFWVTMNVLLWRAEFMGKPTIGGEIPPELVWEKVLTAPDDSSLVVLRNGKQIGYCRWSPNVGEELTTGKVSSGAYQPDGMVKRLTGYSIDLDGNIDLNDSTNRLRFNLLIRLSTNLVWQEFTARSSLRPHSFDLKAQADRQTVQFEYENRQTGFQWDRRFTLGELQNFQSWLPELGMVNAGSRLDLATREMLDPSSLGVTWQARNDWLQVGHSQVRVYRLETRFLDRYRIVVIVSRVGEILRLELPRDIQLLNDVLISY